MGGRKLKDAEEAEACLAAASGSGLSRAVWARRHGIDARSLNAWRLNLGRRRAVEADAGPELRLVELMPAPEEERPSPYRVRCGGFLVEVDARFDDDTLARLLRVVGRC